MESQSFHLSTSLPQKIQLLIRGHAANPERKPHFNDFFILRIADPSARSLCRDMTLIQRFFYLTEPSIFSVYTRRDELLETHHDIAFARKRLQVTCIMERQVALLSWRKDVMTIRVRDTDLKREMLVVGNRKIVEMLDRLPADLKLEGESRV